MGVYIAAIAEDVKESTTPRGWIGISKKPETQTQCGSQKSNQYYRVSTGTTGNYRKYWCKPPVLPVRQEKLRTLKQMSLDFRSMNYPTTKDDGDDFATLPWACGTSNL